MVSERRRRLADLPPGGDSPLNAALRGRDGGTLRMVQEAVRHNETLMAYQPIMQARAPNRTAFYEGLIRVPDATGRIIPAGDFMHLVEDSELGREIDLAALRTGLRTLQANRDLRLSINMSARSIGYGPWVQCLRRYLSRDRALAERLILEITEQSAMTVPEIVIGFMDEWQPQGVSFALDQFGAGVTAIRYFREFCFDILKIDGQFVSGIARDADNRAIVGALLSIARYFDMLTVAERVETEADAACLTDMGVDCLQGYYFAAPTVQPDWLRRPDKRRA
ncbi:MAG: EAL domain-containing protein [Sulfitobacter sp.]|nr:EAL domain-containing protein [Sulfitobacter sp.]